jgi:hypothetical protein
MKTYVIGIKCIHERFGCNCQQQDVVSPEYGYIGQYCYIQPIQAEKSSDINWDTVLAWQGATESYVFDEMFDKNFTVLGELHEVVIKTCS